MASTDPNPLSEAGPATPSLSAQTMRDVRLICSLHSTWQGKGLAEIAACLAKLLGEMLSVEAVFVRLEDPTSLYFEELFHVSSDGAVIREANPKFRVAVEALKSGRNPSATTIPGPSGEGGWVIESAGAVQGEISSLVAVISTAHGFPDDRVQLLTTLFAEQAALAAYHGSIEQTLGLQNARLQSTLQSIADAVITTDKEGRVIHLNPVAELLTGWTTPDAAGRPLREIFDIVAESSRESLENPVEHALREGAFLALPPDTLLVAKDGVERPIEDSAASISTPEGKVSGFVVVFRDASEKRDAKRAIRLSEERKSAVIESAIDCVITMDHEGRIVDFNPAAEATFGHPSKAVVGKPLADLLIPQRFRSAHHEGFHRYLSTGNGNVLGQLLELPALRADGSEFLVEASITAAETGSGEPFFCAFLRDITERKKAEQALRESEKKFRVLSESLPAIVWVSLPDGSLTYISPLWTELTGQSQQEALGLGWAEKVHPDDRLWVMARWEQSSSHGEIYMGEIRYRRHDGEYRWHHFKGLPFRNDSGEITAWYGTSLEGHEFKEVEIALRQARSRLDSTLAAGEVGTWEFDVVNNVVHADKNLARMFGVEPEQARDGGPLEVYTQAIHPDDFEGVAEAIRQAIDSGEHYETEYRIIGADGALRWVTARGKIERDPEGKALRLPGVVVDITAQRRAESDLRSTVLRWRLALDAGESGAWNIDVSTQTLQSDERFRLIFHGSIDPLSYENAFAAIHPEDRDRVREAVAAAKAPRKPFSYSEEFRVIHPDGHIVWVLGKGRGSFEGSGAERRIVSLDGTVTDITDRKKTEESLREVAARLSEADQRKNEFLATLAHELRNPLAPIRTGLEFMRIAGDDRAAVENVRRVMETQTRQLVRLIDDLLDISRITSGKIDLRRERTDLAAAIYNAVDATRPAIDQAGHQLFISVPSNPIHLEADADRLSQIISNLLTNAVRYTDPPGKIWLDLETAGTEALIKVRDTGIGIEREMLDSIFEMFTQADQAKQRAQGGLGIGLTLVKRLSEMHGGSVEVHSEGGGYGAEFIVRLPIQVTSTDSAAIVLEGNIDTPARRKVLVVDDNREAAEILRMVLVFWGNEVRLAHDGIDGVEAAKMFNPDIVLMDIGMPRMNGYEAARCIRDQDPDRKILLVALTGWGQQEDRNKSKHAGFDHHLVKPVDPSILQEVLKECRN